MKVAGIGAMVLLFVIFFIINLILINLGWNLFAVPVLGLDYLSISELFGLSLLISSVKSSSGGFKHE